MDMGRGNRGLQTQKSQSQANAQSGLVVLSCWGGCLLRRASYPFEPLFFKHCLSWNAKPTHTPFPRKKKINDKNKHKKRPSKKSVSFLCLHDTLAVIVTRKRGYYYGAFCVL